MKNKISHIIIILILTSLFCQAQEKQEFKIIVNAKNTVEKEDKTNISRIFLKKQRRWENGDAIKAVDLKDNNEIRVNFSKMVHDRKLSSIKAYWQKQIFTGKGVPPPELASDMDVLKYVQENEGAIGYISVKVSLGNYKVKTIELNFKAD